MTLRKLWLWGVLMQSGYQNILPTGTARNVSFQQIN